MDTQLVEQFRERWQHFFPTAEWPIVFYYTDTVSDHERSESKNEHRCLISNLNRVREGYTFNFDANSRGCFGGKRYTGFAANLRPDFEYFLSCGIPGKMEGERYKKSPEMVKELLSKDTPFTAPARYLVFKRWDKLAATDEPLAVIFFASPDVLSGLFTLANFDSIDPHGVSAPFGSGCSSIIKFPLLEASSHHPKCILGMFDVSARPFVPGHALTFTVPMQRFVEMIGNMQESFLITPSWDEVRKRIVKNMQVG
jgi:hypothetical protein